MKIEVGDTVYAISGEAKVIALNPMRAIFGVMTTVRVQWPEGTTMWLEPEDLLASTAVLIQDIRNALPRVPSDDAICHRGICTRDECANCERILVAHQAVTMLEKRQRC